MSLDLTYWKPYVLPAEVEYARVRRTLHCPIKTNEREPVSRLFLCADSMLIRSVSTPLCVPDACPGSP